MQENIQLKNIQEWSYLVNKLLNNREISIDTPKDWSVLKKYQQDLRNYFEVMGYALCIDEQYAFAYLEESEEMTGESLTIKNKMSFGSTLLLCILREIMYRRETESDPSAPLLVSYEEIKDSLEVFLKEKFENDEKKVVKTIQESIKKVVEYGILIEQKDGMYKINKILRAKMNIAKMQELLEVLKKSFGAEEEEEKGEEEK